MYAMDPGGVRSAGSEIGELGRSARVVADDLDRLRVPRGALGLSIDREATAFLRLWGDGVRAMATELGLLDERCLVSARGVEGEDDAARLRFSAPHDPRLRAAVA